MVTLTRLSRPSVKFIDDYCHNYRQLFDEVRNYEAFKLLHLGLLSELPRKSLPQIARAVGLSNSQSLHHFLQNSTYSTSALTATRLKLILELIGEQEIILCIDESGDVKKGKATDYVSKQYIGNLGKTARGIVSVNAYAVVGQITYPLLFKIFKPKRCLLPGDTYKTKPQLAVEILQELTEMGFQISLVLADSLYGESGDVIGTLQQLGLHFIVAIRSNHGVWLAPGQQVRYNGWKPYQQQLSHRQSESRCIREIIFGKRQRLRYYQITKGETPEPTGDNSWYIMTNIEGKIQLKVAQPYSWRNWIEYGFKQVKNELGWADYRLTNYPSIERWWSLVFSAYLLVSIHANNFSERESARDTTKKITLTSQLIAQFQQHCGWDNAQTWKSALNNLRLIIQPYIFACLLAPWLEVFQLRYLSRELWKLVHYLNQLPTLLNNRVVTNLVAA
jgi:SRSO17 transposase